MATYSTTMPQRGGDERPVGSLNGSGAAEHPAPGVHAVGFDAGAYAQAFRSACARRGIDPQRGASLYQAANVRADLRRAAQRRELRHERLLGVRWWCQPDLWDDSPPHASSVERIVFARLFAVAYLYSARRACLELIRAGIAREARDHADVYDDEPVLA